MPDPGPLDAPPVARAPADDVRETIARRVELLPGDTRRILAAGAVLGRSFDLQVLATMTRLDPAVVAAAADVAVAADVVRNDGNGRYTFSHALIEDSLYGGLPEGRRARLHMAAADALEQRHADAPPLAAIAYHHCRSLPAGDRAVAVDYTCRAAVEAASRGAHEQAVEHYQRALDASANDGGCCLDARGEAALLCDLGDACQRAGFVERAARAYSDAVDRARAAEDATCFAHAALGLAGGTNETVGFSLAGAGDDAITLLDEACAGLPVDDLARRAVLTARLAGLRYDMGEVELAQALSAHALELAQEAGDALAISAALAARHTALSCPEALPQRLAIDEQQRALGTRSVQAYAWSVGDLLECGRIEDADLEIAALQDETVVRNEPRARWFAALYATMRAQLGGDLDTAARRAEDAREIGECLGARTAGVAYAMQSLGVAWERQELGGLVELLDALAEEHPRQPGFTVTAAWARVGTGRHDEARVQLEKVSQDDFAAIPRNGVWLANMRTLAEISFALGARDEAATLYELLLPYRDRFVVTSRLLALWGSIEHSLGLLALTTGDLDAAEEHLDRARHAHRALAAPLLTARTELARAALLDARGDREAAADLRADVGAEAVRKGWPGVAADAASGVAR